MARATTRGLVGFLMFTGCGGRIVDADAFPNPGTCTQIAGGAPSLPPNPMSGEPASPTGGTITPGRYFAQSRMEFTGDSGSEIVPPLTSSTVYEFYDDSTGISRVDYSGPGLTSTQTMWTAFSYTTSGATFVPIDTTCGDAGAECVLCPNGWSYTADGTTLTLNHTYQDGILQEEETLILVIQ